MQRQSLLLAAIVCAYLIIVGRAVRYDYVWDDVHEIQNARLLDAPLLDGITATQTDRSDPTLTELTGIELAYDSFRPVLFVTYWTEVRLWGRAPAPMHAANLVLGALSIIAMWFLSRRLLGTSQLAILPPAIFALHPALIEPVAYISGRGDLLVGLLSIAAALAMLRSVEGKRSWAIVALLAFAAAVFTKESAIGVPIAIAALLWSKQQLRAGRAALMVMAFIGAAYLLIRQLVTVPTTNHSLGRALVQLPGVCLEYVRISASPFDLSTERLHAPTLALAGWIIVGIAVVGAVLAHRQHAETVRAIAGGSIWFVVLLAPSAVAVTSSGVAADRYLYAPLIGLSFAIGATVGALLKSRPRMLRPLQVLAAIWGVLLFTVGWRQVPVWGTNETLYAHAAMMTPNSSDAFYRLGYLAASQGDWDQAVPLLVHATELNPHNVRALNNLGVGYLRTGHALQAEAALARAVEANPGAYRAWLNLGLAHLALGKRAPGCAAILKALEIAPEYAIARTTYVTRCRN